ncbi:MAG: hypothetical protein K5879_07260 [Lachnospiraceae bacterium]|nr:hypothetical protein [Lachnospiraceae bacterium]
MEYSNAVRICTLSYEPKRWDAEAHDFMLALKNFSGRIYLCGLLMKPSVMRSFGFSGIT